MTEQQPVGLLNNFKSKEEIDWLKEMISISKKNELQKNKKSIKLKIKEKHKRRDRNKQARKVRRQKRR